MMGYNGWKNYETWCTALWLDNDQTAYEMTREVAKSGANDHTIADWIKEFVEENNPLNDQPATMFTDLLNGALSEVDWREIVDHYKED